MKAAVWSWLLVGVVLCATVPAGAQTPVGALAIDERQGDQYGWAVYYETPAAARGFSARDRSGLTVATTIAAVAGARPAS